MISATEHPDAKFSSEFEKSHGANWREWLGHLKGTPAKGLELGTWLGESAEWAIGTIFTHPDARYHCVDTFEGSEEHHLAGIDCTICESETRKRLAPFGYRAKIFKEFSDQAMKGMYSKEKFDFIYVDAAHDAMNVLRDSVLAFDLLKPGGILLWDDYEWRVFQDPAECPKLAIDSFIAAYGKRLEIVGMGWQVCAKKL